MPDDKQYLRRIPDQPVKAGDHIAVYGELIAQFSQLNGSPALRGALRLLGPCWISGSLYAIGNTAALVPGDDGQVFGELYEVLHPRVGEWCDQVIEADSKAAGVRFERRRMRLVEPEVDAWAYVWGVEQKADGRPVAGGDWRAHLGQSLVIAA